MDANSSTPPPEPEPPLGNPAAPPPAAFPPSEGFRTPHSALRTSSARKGKIARLPRAIRDQLNQRLDDGQEAKQLAPWLNSLPEVQAVLADHFNRQPINEVNLTHWKQGGFLDWQNLNQKRDSLNQLVEDAADLHSAAGDVLPEKLAQFLAADLAITARTLLESATGPEDRWQRLRELLPELARLRHDGHRSQLLELSRRRSDRLEAQAQASQAESRQRARISTRAQEQLISHLYASADPSLKALAVELAENLLSAEDPPTPHSSPLSEAKSRLVGTFRAPSAPPPTLDTRLIKPN